MNLKKLALEWAINHLTSNTGVTKHKRIVETAYSIVYKIKTNRDIFYLKITPQSLFLESKLLQFMNAQGLPNIPEFIAEEQKLYCFLTRDCGHKSLRHLFHKAIDFKQLKTGISNYNLIQRTMEKDIATLLALGLPDWRLDKFPALYKTLIQQKDLLLWDGLTTNELSQLQERVPLCEKYCEELALINLPQTLSHGDFHENNMLFHPKTKAINLIDWGESVISHPFFSLNSCLWNLGYFHASKLSEQDYAALRLHAIEPWRKDYEEKILLRAFHLANNLLGVYAALAYQRLYLATDQQFTDIKEKHRGAIAGCLRSFLKIH